MNTETLNFTDSDLSKLAKTGFKTEIQIQMLANSKDRQQWLSQTRQDIKGFIVEYLQEGLVLPNPIEFASINGQERVKGKLYGERPLLDCVSSQERYGAVKNVIAEVEEFLLKKKPGSIAFFTSPPGWSGFEGINYHKAQTYTFRVNENRQLESFNFVTDMTAGQHQKLLQNFRVKDFTKSRDEKVRLSDITSKLVTLEDKNYQFTDIVDAIKQVKQSEYANGNKKFDVIYQNLDRGENLLNLDEESEKVIKEFEDWVMSLPTNLNKELMELIEEKLSQTILKLSRVIRKGESAMEVKKMTPIDYQTEYQYVSNLDGCNGGGFVDTGLGSREVSHGSEYWRTGKCRRCFNVFIDVGPCGICRECERRYNKFDSSGY